MYKRQRVRGSKVDPRWSSHRVGVEFRHSPSSDFLFRRLKAESVVNSYVAEVTGRCENVNDRTVTDRSVALDAPRFEPTVQQKEDRPEELVGHAFGVLHALEG